MESKESKFLKVILRVIRVNRIWKLTGDKLRKVIEKKQLSEKPEPPKNIKEKFNIEKKDISGYCYYEMSPIGAKGEKHILYLHGGGYVLEIMSLHWEFLAKLSEELKCTIIIPIYPLAPRYNYQEVFKMIFPIYEKIISKVKSKDVVIMGDSAGGGISLALAQLAREENLPQPKDIILISPILDMSFNNPEIKDIEKHDPIAAVPALLEIGDWYRGDKDISHYLISPIYGNLEGLGRISLFIGTYDILYADAKKFKKILEEKGIAINYYEYTSMLHVWPMFSLPESKKAREEIFEIVRKDI